MGVIIIIALAGYGLNYLLKKHPILAKVVFVLTILELAQPEVGKVSF
jgi:hypothetical protein